MREAFLHEICIGERVLTTEKPGETRYVSSDGGSSVAALEDHPDTPAEREAPTARVPRQTHAPDLSRVS